MRGFSAPTHGFSAPRRATSALRRGSPGHGREIFTPAPGGVFGSGACNGFVPCGPLFFVPPRTGTALEPNFGVINGVPGLGFDFPHLAAINRGFQNRFAFVDTGFFNNGFFPFFTPIFFDALPSFYPPYQTQAPDYYAEAERQPIFVITPQQLQALPPVPAEAAASAPATPQAPPSPPPELGQLILVRRDGQILLAVAFTVRNGQLTYVTNEGTRRSFAVSELDKDATRQMNDANGTSVSLPN